MTDVAVIGLPDAVLGERACAVVVPAARQRVELAELVEFLRAAHVASFKLPEALRVVDSLPRNPLGKVLKRELRARFNKPAGAGVPHDTEVVTS